MKKKLLLFSLFLIGIFNLKSQTGFPICFENYSMECAFEVCVTVVSTCEGSPVSSVTDHCGTAAPNSYLCISAPSIPLPPPVPVCTSVVTHIKITYGGITSIVPITQGGNYIVEGIFCNGKQIYLMYNPNNGIWRIVPL